MIPMRIVDNVTIFDMKGKLGNHNESVSIFRDTLYELSVQKNKKVLLNLADVPYVHSDGIGEMVRGFTIIKNSGGSLKLLSPSQRVRDLLIMTKLFSVFEVFDDEDMAVSSFN
jgi:anti-sigma B factor antagonist